MIADLEAQKSSQDEFFEKTLEKLNNENNPQPTEGIDRVIDKTYDNPSEANEVKQGLKDVENAVKDGNEKNNNAVKSDIKADNNSIKSDNKATSADTKQATINDTVQVSKNLNSNGNLDLIMKTIYNMADKEPDGYERWKRGEYDEGNKLMSNIFSDDAFMNRAKKPYEDAINSFNETVNKLNDIKLNQQPVNVTTGDIVIQNPVGNTKQLAQEIKNELQKEALMEIPNAAMKTIHSNLK